MKRLFVILIAGLMTCNLFAQSSTEGKDFWVALTSATSPNGSDNHVPYLAVSAKKACTVTITNPQTNWSITVPCPGPGTTLTNNTWTEIKTGTGAQQIPMAQWYPNGAAATAVSEHTHNLGLHVTATEEISLFAAQRMTNSFDAANILPITALQYEYIIQDYPPYEHDDKAPWSTYAILATEDNTTVTILPKGAKKSGNAGDPVAADITTNITINSHNNSPITVTLNKGQVYHVISAANVTMSGTRVTADKKIAVFNGDVFTDLPGEASARDCLYEQAMPIDYWGREFVVTRSMRRDADRVRITAQEDGTTIQIDGMLVGTINATETFEVELSEDLSAAFKPGSSYKKFPPDITISGGYGHYIQTSCPCAVYLYMVSNKYKQKDASASEQKTDKGDPSMVWISPLEQRINTITFGVCGTDKTTDHYLNVVMLAADTASLQIRAQNGTNIIDAQDHWTVVPGTQYAFLRKQVATTSTSGKPNPVYTMTASSGFIAHVYGNGDNESYAYSVGSSAVKRGIQIGDYTLENGTVGTNTYCVNTPIHFNAQVGSDVIDAAYWDMGDGVTMTDQSRIAHDYMYDTPGWYDVVASVRAHKVCPDTPYPPEDVSVRIHVVRPDTIRRQFFVCENDLPFIYGGDTLTQDTTAIAYFDCDSVVIFSLEIGKNSQYEYWENAKDSVVFQGKSYYKSGDYTATLTNKAGCDSLLTLHASVVTCLEITVGKPASVICADEIEFQIPYNHTRGEIGAAYLMNRGLKTPITANPVVDAFVIPLKGFTADHYTNAAVIVEDHVCERTLTFPVSFDVLYPSSVFNQKWDNTLVLYNEKFNGGYDFKAYQWYKDGQPIPGATGSYLVENPLDTAALYQVMLTRLDTASGEYIELMTCPYQPVVKKPKNSPQNAEKLIENGRLYIIKDNTKFSVLGVAVKKEELR